MRLHKTLIAGLMIAVSVAGGASAAELKFPATNPAGTLRAGDVVEFTVYDLVGPGVATPFTVRIDEKGRVKLPLLDEIEVAGKTNDAASTPIAKAYAKAGILANANVTVSIVTTAAQLSFKPGPLGTGDTLRVTIFDLYGPGKRTEVDAAVADDGTITLPLVGAVKVAGQSEGDASRTIVKAYADGNILRNSTISVLRTASGS